MIVKQFIKGQPKNWAILLYVPEQENFTVVKKRQKTGDKGRR